jgi:hypothetical protein
MMENWPAFQRGIYVLLCEPRLGREECSLVGDFPDGYLKIWE